MSDEAPTTSWRLDPDTRAALRLDKARTAMRDHDWSRAVVELEELLDEDPAHAEGLRRLTASLLELRDHLTAREAARTYLERVGESPAMWCTLAHTAFECCAFEDAAAAARRALELRPDSAEAHFLLALALERTHPGTADPHFDEAHLLHPLAYPRPIRIADADWSLIVADVFEHLDPRVQAFWETVPMALVPFPEVADLMKQVPPVSPRVVALYKGEPPAAADPEARPAKLRIYTGNLAHADSPEVLMMQLGQALEEEALDWIDLE